jgi:peptidyl-prolyl cis-trans isomerase C
LNRATSRHAVALAAALSVSVAFAPAAPAQTQGRAPAGAPAPAAGQNSGAPAPAPAQPAVDANKVVLTVGDQKITAGEMDALIGSLPGQQQQMLQQAGKRVLAEKLVEIKLLAQEAQKRKLDQDPKVRRQIELMRDQILAGEVASDVLRQHYSENKEKYEKIRARHILIRTPGSRVPVRPGQKEMTDAEAKSKAEGIRKEIQGGADFAEMARKESDDTGSGARGGDLDVFGHGMMVPEFDKVAFGLKKGEVSEPVKTQFGYHIIQVTDVLSFDELQQDIANQNSPQIKKMVEDLRKNGNVQIDEGYFGPERAPKATTGIPGAPGAPGAAGNAQQPAPLQGNAPAPK